MADPGVEAGEDVAGLHELLEGDAEDLYDHAPCGYLSALPDGTIAKVNQTFLTWTGYERADLVGKRRFQELLTAGGQIYHETHYAPMLRMQGWVREIAVDIVRADGTRLPALINSTLKHTEDGEPLLVRTMVFDATERREYERELLRARQRAEESEARARLLAQTLQSSLIPPAAPEVPGLDVGAVYRPAFSGDEVGGDFYDIFELPGGDWGLVIGDVCGKGAQAATVTALARHTVRAAAIREPRPEAVLGLLNEALLRQGSERFCTVAFARITAPGPAGVTIQFASGGHPLPLLLSGSMRPHTVGRAGDLLGVLERPELVSDTLPLGAGETLVFFTDGISEGRRGKEFYGDERVETLLSSLRDHDAAGIAEALVADVVAFQSGLPRDDIAVVTLKAPAAG